jgi:hypothetical protein
MYLGTKVERRRFGFQGDRGYGVHATRMKWMATAQTFQPQPDSLRHAMQLHGLHHVYRTCRMKPASRWKHRRKPALVEAKQSKNDYLHRDATFATSRRISSKGASRQARRGLNTTIQRLPKEWRSKRTASRTRRRIRFRTTALPSALGVVKPNSGPVARSAGEKTKAAK